MSSSSLDKSSSTGHHQLPAPPQPLEPPTLLYHESAFGIVFRDQIRKVQKRATTNTNNNNADCRGHTTTPHAYAASAPSSASSSRVGSRSTTPHQIRPGGLGSGLKDTTVSATNKKGKVMVGGISPSSSQTTLRKYNTIGGGIAKPAPEANTMIRARRAPSPPPPSSSSSSLGHGIPSSSSPSSLTVKFDPLPQLELTKNSVFKPLEEECLEEEQNLLDGSISGGVTVFGDSSTSNSTTKKKNKLSANEKYVIKLFEDQQCVIKTIRNADWTPFLEKFPHPGQSGNTDSDGDNNDNNDDESNNADENGMEPFKTSTTLLPSNGLKMRCFGSTKEFTVGCVFALPTVGDSKADAYTSNDEMHRSMVETKTWAWPSGYAAKTEFNSDKYGNLINGREEALVSLDELRQKNHSYLYDDDYIVGGRLIKGGLTAVPYNEVMPRVGGHPPLVGYSSPEKGNKRFSTGEDEVDDSSEQNLDQEKKEKLQNEGDGGTAVRLIKRSFEDGLGYAVALFVRTANYGHLVALLRARARAISVWGKDAIPSDIPLLYISPEQGVKVITKSLQGELFTTLARHLNPFQNPLLYQTGIHDYSTHEDQMQQKLEELIDLNDGEWRSRLTADECARIAGGFGATDDSVAKLLMDALHEDQLYKERKKEQELAPGLRRNMHSFHYADGHRHEGHELQDIVNEGLVAAVRSGDYHTSRQLLILYTLVASRGERDNQNRSQASTSSLKGPGRSRQNSMDTLSSAGSSTHNNNKEGGSYDDEDYMIGGMGSMNVYGDDDDDDDGPLTIENDNNDSYFLRRTIERRSSHVKDERALGGAYTSIGGASSASAGGGYTSDNSKGSRTSRGSRTSKGSKTTSSTGGINNVDGRAKKSSSSSTIKRSKPPQTHRLMLIDTKKDIQAEPESTVVTELPRPSSLPQTTMDDIAPENVVVVPFSGHSNSTFKAKEAPSTYVRSNDQNLSGKNFHDKEELRDSSNEDTGENSQQHNKNQITKSSVGTTLKKKRPQLTKQESERRMMEAATKVPMVPNVVPPPLDTNRLRSATNSDGLLAVLGAAQVLKAMQDGSAKVRAMESIEALEEWVATGEQQGVAFRLAAWRDQRAAQADLKIAMQHQSDWTAFVGKHAITNRKHFCSRLKKAVDTVDFTDIAFLKLLHDILGEMNSPCLRLELLQYMLGLDNRYSVAHVARSVELAATCMNISKHDLHHYIPQSSSGLSQDQDGSKALSQSASSGGVSVEQELASMNPDEIIG